MIEMYDMLNIEFNKNCTTVSRFNRTDCLIEYAKYAVYWKRMKNI